MSSRTGKTEETMLTLDEISQLHSQQPPWMGEFLDLLVPREASPAADWLSISQAATTSSLSEKTIRRAIYAKGRDQLKAYDVGTPRRSTWRIRATDLDAWMSRNGGGIEIPPPVPSYRAKHRSSYFKGF